MERPPRPTTCYDTTTRSPYRSPPYSWSYAARTAPTVQGRREVISADILRRHLRSDRLRARRHYAGPTLIDIEMNADIGQEGIVIGDTTLTLCAVLWPSPFSLILRNADGRLQVWRRRRERYHNDCHRWGGWSFMMWVGISYHHRTALHVCPGRMNAIY